MTSSGYTLRTLERESWIIQMVRVVQMVRMERTRRLRMNTTESSRQRRQSSRGVSLLSCIQTRFSRLRPHEHEHDHHTTTRFNPTRLRVGSLPQGHPGLWGTAVGPGRTPTVHWCPTGKAVGGPNHNLTRHDKDNDKTQVTASSCLSP